MPKRLKDTIQQMSVPDGSYQTTRRLRQTAEVIVEKFYASNRSPTGLIRSRTAIFSPKDGTHGYPEIYVMGCRNPFRVSVDPKTKFVYWGDVGPDTNVPAEEGFLSYDEINQARKPGFFGYPYFLGNNEGFPKYDFATKKKAQSRIHCIR